jgi:hypothetical protein
VPARYHDIQPRRESASAGVRGDLGSLDPPADGVFVDARVEFEGGTFIWNALCVLGEALLSNHLLDAGNDCGVHN